MSTFRGNLKEWQEYMGEEKGACFLCGIQFSPSEHVVHWTGNGGPRLDKLPFIPDDPLSLLIVDALVKRSGFSPAFDIFLHPTCMPAFGRRILENWEWFHQHFPGIF